MIKVNVLLASYNGEKYIREQIDSILINFENVGNEFDCKILISDDASTDNTIEVINNYFNNDSRVEIVSGDKKGGVKENFYFLISNVDCDAEYVFFSDQDDFWLPSKMRIFLNTLTKYDALSKGKVPLLVHSDLVVTNELLIPKKISMFNYQGLNRNANFKELLVTNSVTGCVMACNKKLIKIAKQSKIQNSIMHDWYIALLASACGDIKFIDEPLILYRQHSNNQVGAKSDSLFNRLKNKRILNLLEDARHSISLTKNQAKLFLSEVNLTLPYEKAVTLKLYCGNGNDNLIKRFFLFLSGVRKKGFIKNVVFFILFVMGR
ncbi:putative glycosyl transferase [Pluralibacter gergoviae]|uniref:glycosyltransferase family 2 protein n=1 Tax=Pluralibacter gergoviae TaxID=61647 RepID=UPI0009081FF2|nr:glycosyltransferase family 2 protein [Pluralibacter gergoviae]SUB70555.1 putative glycosyl transferase [Pluralibacter gergoviae]